MSDGRIAVDVDEVTAVVDYYRCAADGIGAAADDLAGYEFGRWAVGDAYRELGDRYRDTGRLLARHLADQADAAGALADDLTGALAVIVEGDADATAALRQSVDESGSGPGSRAQT